MLDKLQLYNFYFELTVSLVGSVLTSVQGLIPRPCQVMHGGTSL